MKMDQRREKIVELINQERAVSFSQLKAAFRPVSDMTLRRDLEYLDRSKRIIRTHGGARSAEILVGTDDLYLRRSTRNAAGKRVIAEKAVQLLQQNTAIYIDSGSTCTEFAKVLPDGPYMIFTNSISVALELSRLQEAQVHLIGGCLNASSLCVNGAMAMRELDNINFHTGFLGVSGYSPTRGFTCGVAEDSALKRAVAERAERVVMLMDAQKVDTTSTFTFASPEDIDVLITDVPLPDKALHVLSRSNVEVL